MKDPWRATTDPWSRPIQSACITKRMIKSKRDRRCRSFVQQTDKTKSVALKQIKLLEAEVVRLEKLLRKGL